MDPTNIAILFHIVYIFSIQDSILNYAALFLSFIKLKYKLCSNILYIIGMLRSFDSDSERSELPIDLTPPAPIILNRRL